MWQPRRLWMAVARRLAAGLVLGVVTAVAGSPPAVAAPGDDEAPPTEPEPSPRAEPPAAGPEPVPPAPAPPAPAPFDSSHQGRLTRAGVAYQRGNRDEARKLLSELLLDPTLSDATVRQEARLSMAELLLAEGEEAGAQRFLEQVLREDPSYRVDPFRYPPAVIDQYGYVRALLGPELDKPPEEPQPVAVVAPTPLNVWSPFAPYHFRQGRKVRGVIYSTGWVTTWAAATMLHGFYLADRSYVIENDGEKQTLVDLRATQWSLTGANWAFYIASVIDAQIHWRRKGAAASLQQARTPRRRTVQREGLTLRF